MSFSVQRPQLSEVQGSLKGLGVAWGGGRGEGGGGVGWWERGRGGGRQIELVSEARVSYWGG